MNLRTRLVTFVAALAMLAGIGALVSSPAYAAYSDCPSGAFCTYWNGSGGNPQYYYWPQSAGTCINIGGGWNDQISSVENRTGRYITTWNDANCNWWGITVYPQGQNGSRWDSLPGFNDQMSSFRWT